MGAQAFKELLIAHGLGRPFDIVYIDWRMPGMDGVTATQAVRRMARLRHLPIVGMNGFLSKPIDPDVLWATLLKWIKPRGMTLDTLPGVALDFSFDLSPEKRGLTA